MSRDPDSRGSSPHELPDSDSLFLGYLSALTRADGEVHESEQELLDRLARYLGPNGRRRTRRYRRKLGDLMAWRPKTQQGRIDLFGMLAKLAWADGVLRPAEERFLEQAARTFELEPISAARILAEAEYRARRHDRLRRNFLIGGGLLSVTLLMVAVFLSRRERDPDLAALRRHEKQYEPSILLLHVTYELENGQGTRSRHSTTGSGFFVSATGDAVTNKHVLQPWKFRGDAWQRLAEGWALDPASYEIYAWPVGSEVFDAESQQRRLQSEHAFRLSAGTLHVLDLPPDDWTVYASSPLSEHAGSNEDLALIHCTSAQVVAPLPLAPSTAQVEALDSILVMGFPRGLRPLEEALARCSPVIGWVRKREATILISAPIHPGNSGGPLIDVDGNVIGVATRISSGDATMGQCIRSEHVAALLANGNDRRSGLDRAVLTGVPPAAH